MSLDGCSNPPCLGAWIRERQLVLAKEPGGIREGFPEGAEALIPAQEISREQPDAAASLRVGTVLVPRCCLWSSWALVAGVGRVEGDFFLAGEKKINLLSVQQLTLGLAARNVCSAARDTAVATATAERGDTLPLPPSAPQNRAEQGK